MTRASQRNRKPGIFSIAGIALATALAVAIASPWVSLTRAQTATPPPGGPPVAGAPQGTGAPAAEAAAAAPPAAVAKTAGDAFMNVTVLNNIPADQLISSMQFIATSLGQNCTFCHVVPNYEDDSKHTKTVARQMIQMELDINKTNFHGNVEVTCNTCHRGSAHPVGMPLIPDEGQMAMAPPSMPSMDHGPGGTGPGGPPAGGAPGAGPGGPSANGGAGTAPGTQPALPTVDQILDKYTQAIGGPDAFAKLTSRKAEGTGTYAGGDGAGEAVTIDVMQEAPNKRWMSLAGKNESFTEGTDGADFWNQDAKGQVHDVQGIQFTELKREADMTWLLDIRKNFSQLRAVGTDQIGDHKAYVVIGVPAGGGPRERLLFDADSGLLLRYAFVAPSPLGNNPIQADFSDYRDAGGGLKLPFTVRTATPNAALTVHFSQIQINVPVDDGKFAKPESVMAPTSAPDSSAPPAKQ
jgi:photosynthetic reaction center cytochrome c subunit